MKLVETVVSIAQVAHIGRYIWPWYFFNSMLYIDIHKISYDTCFSIVCLIRKQCHCHRQVLVHPVSLRHRMYGFLYFASEGKTHYPEWESIEGHVEQSMVEWMALWLLFLVWLVLTNPTRAFRRFFTPRAWARFIEVIRRFIRKLVIFSEPHIRKTILGIR